MAERQVILFVFHSLVGEVKRLLDDRNKIQSMAEIVIWRMVNQKRIYGAKLPENNITLNPYNF